MQRFDKATGFLIADPDLDYITRWPDYSSVLKAAEPLILSASGWRKIFAVDGDEESSTELIENPLF
jgi:phosphoglucomutase